ncbi:MAG TPA: fused MFS/spermidine synthase [Pyrinomonadaceae bacterium]|nr:fused MFS/spermidine synthase [Pyrinomonadaceae bacterium]
MSLLFAAALFTSAALLFWVQPLVGKMLLPLLGGTPAVWNTCLLFFQAALLAGYAYALAVTRWLGTRAQVALHLLLLAAAALALPVAVSEATAADAPAEGSPALWLLSSLLATVGPPFFVLSASAPLLQKWFAATRSAAAGDPYFLYAASNAGSLAALLGFPLLLEPNWTLAEQGRGWAFLYGALALLVAACGLAAWRQFRVASFEFRVEDKGLSSPDSAVMTGSGGGVNPRADEVGTDDESSLTRNSKLATRNLTWRQRLRWTLLAFVPSSLVLGATTYITTDVASVPLLWVVPLALYLLSFVLVFARRTLLRWRAAARLLPGAGVLLALVYLSGATEPAWFLILFHLLFLFTAAVVCHGQLAEERPAPRHLAEFYLWLSTGGALGGLFNAILAPLLFDSVAEYPLVIVLACYLRPAARAPRFRLPGLRLSDRPDEAEEREEPEGRRALWRDLAYAVGPALLLLLLALVAEQVELKVLEKTALMLGVPLLLLNHLAAHRPLRFAMGLAAVMLAGVLVGGRAEETIYAERNFFGVLRASIEESGETVNLYHGSTLHGRQYTDPSRACEPLSYYHRQGPLGSVFEAFESRPGAAPAVAVVGLGTGASAAYARVGQHWTFYEIDPAVERLARGPAFTYLSDCAAAPVEVVLGDARLRLREAAPEAYGLIVLDAFSSDAVPAHLLTREALDLYLSKLAPGGLIAYHTSNRSLNLQLVAGGVARDAGLAARVYGDAVSDPLLGKDRSEWVVVARRPEDLGPLASDPRWETLDEQGPRLEVWRDDFSDILGVFKWL